ncbi:MAG TPA: decarboxylating 6-phosphogluconate dehydrogenase, partial [Terriglobales bacterium]
MQLGMVGLGRMGGNMVRRLMRGGHQLVVSDLSAQTVDALSKEGATGSTSLQDLVQKLTPPRAVWIMVPAGDPTEKTVLALSEAMESGDAIIDGGNSYFKDDVRRSKLLEPKGVHYIDVGTSGGVWGLERGYCMMIGGPKQAFDRLEPIFKTLAPGRGEIPATAGREGRASTAEEGYLYCGPSGAGHFVKMVHNGIEYGLMEAYGEGFELLFKSKFNLDLHQVCEVWNRGSVIRSWLLQLAEQMLQSQPKLAEVLPYVEDSGEGRWTIHAAMELAVPVPVIAAALFSRYESRDDVRFAARFTA